MAKKLYLANIEDDNVYVSSAVIEEEADDYFVLRTKLAGTRVVNKKIIHDSNGSFFSFGFSPKGALIKLKAKQEEQIERIQNIINKIDSLM